MEKSCNRVVVAPTILPGGAEHVVAEVVGEAGLQHTQPQHRVNHPHEGGALVVGDVTKLEYEQEI